MNQIEDIHYFVRKGWCDEVMRLLDEEDVNKRDDKGWTVVMAAACEGHTEVVKLLAKREADLNLVNEKHFGMTSLCFISIV